MSKNNEDNNILIINNSSGKNLNLVKLHTSKNQNSNLIDNKDIFIKNINYVNSSNNISSKNTNIENESQNAKSEDKKCNLNETSKYSKQDIVNKAGIEVGKNIFIEYFKSDKKAVTTLPYVESIKLRLKLPNEININVVERTSKYFAYDKDSGKFFSLSEDGYILEEIDINGKKNDEILLTGVTFDDDVMLGKKINDIDLSKIDIYKKIEKEFKKDNISGNITKVSFENSLTTITINDKLNIIFANDSDLEYKMVFLKTILQSIAEDSVGVIDMTKTRPTYSSF